jgi:hypothetical protein
MTPNEEAVLNKLPPIIAVLPHVMALTPCGSRVTCSPPPLDTDADFLLVTRWEKRGEVENSLRVLGFEVEGNEMGYPDDDSDFKSYRRGHLNIIITEDIDFATKHHIATKICKDLNLMKKRQRVSVFQSCLYGTYSLAPKCVSHYENI